MDAHPIDAAKVEAFALRAVGDIAAAYTGILVSVGSKLGLYRALADAGAASAAEVAARAGCAERYVEEWLNAQAAAGYVTYHPASATYELPAEHVPVLADPDSPAYIPPAWDLPAALWAGESKTLQAFRSGRGIAWGEHDPRMACGVAAFYRNGYRANLVSRWLPALDGALADLERGIDVADVGCGHGHSTLLMAQAFPNSRFHGFDTHAASVEAARRSARAAALGDRVRFELARADDFPDRRYGLVCFFDVLHDLGDPVAAARRAAATLAPGGRVLLVEPFANDRVEDNLNPVGRLYYGGSTMICCAHALAEGGRQVLGAQAGERRLAEVLRQGGLTRLRRADQTAFNLVLEARP